MTLDYTSKSYECNINKYSVRDDICNLNLESDECNDDPALYYISDHRIYHLNETCFETIHSIVEKRNKLLSNISDDEVYVDDRVFLRSNGFICSFGFCTALNNTSYHYDSQLSLNLLESIYTNSKESNSLTLCIDNDKSNNEIFLAMYMEN